MSFITSFASAKNHLRRLKSSSKDRGSKDRGGPLTLNLRSNSTVTLGLAPVQVGVATRKACLDRTNGVNFTYGSDLHLKAEDGDCCLEMHQEYIDCERCNTKKEEQFFMFVPAFDEEDGNYLLMGFPHKDRAKIVEYAPDVSDLFLRLGHPEDANLEQSQKLFDLGEDFEEFFSKNRESKSKKSRRKLPSSKDRGEEEYIELETDENFKMGLLPLVTGTDRQACIDDSAASCEHFEFTYGSDLHLKAKPDGGPKGCLEVDHKEDSVVLKKCKKNKEEQVWLFTKPFDESDDDFGLIGFHHDRAYIIEYDPILSPNTHVSLVKPEYAGKDNDQLFHIDDHEDFFERK